MNRFRLICSMVILGIVICTGCARTTKVEQLSSEICDLNAKINQINTNLDVLRPAIEEATKEAIRANKRLDNQVTSYYK